ncbi:AMMECR1 domain-containing protein [Candidatus Woesearchaeota archaeon CG10_big_fil_rev_8_21_14_0_10_47_5]|nr:MAG: AMMECR1 domain-containing protein [Candidatus Woesearchaeota archaeon CG10_big_fil_rev_8_21_14_0_10_47_5]
MAVKKKMRSRMKRLRKRRIRRVKGVVIGCLLLVLLIIIAKRSGFISTSSYSGTGNESQVLDEAPRVREPAVSDQFYPADKEHITTLLSQYLSRADPRHGNGTLKALIEPHAGYVYSGWTAAYGYKLLYSSGIRRVIILGPSHHTAFDGIALSNATHFRTPLGLVRLSSVNHELPDSSLFRINEEAHKDEHSIEVELPFLQSLLGDFELVPLIVGRLSADQLRLAAGRIAPYLDDQTLLIASSDLSHYHAQDEALALDTNCLRSIVSIDIPSAALCEMCGYFPVLILLEIASEEGYRAELLNYSTSGDITGDTSAVVGYAAVAFYSDMHAEGVLSASEQDYLLRLARASIEQFVRNSSLLNPDKDGFPAPSEALKAEKGAFVTIEKHGMLRGCVGHIFPQEPLYLAVRDNAINAASKDPRFSPLSVDELNDIAVEVSVLTVPEEASLEDITPFKDGVVLVRNGNSATYLPQVWEQMPSKEEFLSSLCMKAGLEADCWRDSNTGYLTYRAQVFGES